MTFEEEVNKCENQIMKFIGEYLIKRAIEDPSISENIKKHNKSLEECYLYIIGEISKKAKDLGEAKVYCGVDPSELYNMAIHYYDEDDIKIEKLSNAKVVTNIANNRTNETDNANIKQVPKIKKKLKDKKKTETVEGQLSLFG